MKGLSRRIVSQTSLAFGLYLTKVDDKLKRIGHHSRLTIPGDKERW